MEASARPGAAAAGAARARKLPGALPVVLTLAYAALEYARPQDTIPGLQYLKLSMLVSALLLVCLIQWSQRVPWFHPQLALYALILSIMAAWVPFATNNFWAFKTTWVLLQTYVFSVSLATFLDDEKRIRQFTLLWVASGLFQAIWGTLHAGRGTGYFQGDENDFALSMCMILPFAVMPLGHMERAWQKLLCAASAMACIVGVVVSDSRGGFVGLLATGGLMVLLHPRRVRFFLIGAAASATFIALVGPAYWKEMDTIFDEGGTRADRVHLWGIAWKVYLANPVLGVGPGNINWVLGEYEPFDPEARSDNGRAVHSLYMTTISEMGTVGALLFLAMLMSDARDLTVVIRARGRPGRPVLDGYARATACSLVAFLACGAFLTVIWYPHLYLLTGFTVALARATGAGIPSPERAPDLAVAPGALPGAGA